MKSKTGEYVGLALASYIAINFAALCAAIEFGIQPLIAKDAAGMLLNVLRFTSFLLLPVSALGLGVTAAIKSDRSLIHRLEAVGGYLLLLLLASAGAFLSELLTFLATGLK